MDLCYFHTNQQYSVEITNTYIMEARVLNKKIKAIFKAKLGKTIM